MLAGELMLDGVMIVWFALTGASVAFVIWDSVFNGVTSWVQRIAWILVAIMRKLIVLANALIRDGRHWSEVRP
ncbi:MAG: hypothetical protein AAGB11_14280 [Pseudomonadota bacterium]